MGKDKASLIVGSESLLARTVRVLSGVASRIVVVLAPDQEVSLDFERVIVVRDERPHEGPLVALVLGLEAIGDQHGPVFVCGADHPCLSVSVIRRLAELARGRGAALAQVGGGRQLLCGVYGPQTLETARALVAAGERSMRVLAAQIDVRDVTAAELLSDPEVAAHDPALRTFLDVDTPEDLQRLERGE